MEAQEFLLGTDMYRGQYGAWNPSYVDFVILKATEGKTYNDPCMEKFIAQMADTVPDSPPFIGFYHYAHPENNTVEQEVDNYLKKIKPHIGNCFTALDFEGDAFKIKFPDHWALEWCDKVKKATGTKPFLYVSASYACKFPMTLCNYPLWAAHYNVAKPFSKQCSLNPLMWQYTSKPFDLNIFYGNNADMVKLIKGV